MDDKLKMILSACTEDRRNVIAKGQTAWSRRCGIDLLLKMLLVYINSIGTVKILSQIDRGGLGPALL